MSKYTELAIKTNAVEDVKTRVEKSAPILAAKLNAVISSQSAVVMEAQENDIPIIELPCNLTNRMQVYPETKKYLTELGFYKI
jgi:hypothetical protein